MFRSSVINSFICHYRKKHAKLTIGWIKNQIHVAPKVKNEYTKFRINNTVPHIV